MPSVLVKVLDFQCIYCLTTDGVHKVWVATSRLQQDSATKYYKILRTRAAKFSLLPFSPNYRHFHMASHRKRGLFTFLNIAFKNKIKPSNESKGL